MRAEWYDAETRQYVKSDEEYDAYNLIAGRQREDDWLAPEAVTLVLYKHEKTGLVTTEPERFEAWLRTIERGA